MKIGILYTCGVFFDGHRYTTDAYQHHQFAYIAQHFDATDVVAHVKRSSTQRGRETMRVDRIRVLPLPFCENGWQLYVTRIHRWLPALVRIIRQNRDTWDAVVLYDLLLPNQMAYVICRLFRLPVVLMVQGRAADGMRQAHRFDRIPKRWLGLLYARWLAVAERVLVSRAPTVADFVPNGRSSSDRAADRFLLYSGAIVSEDSRSSSAKEQPPDLRLLVVARVVPIKAVEVAIEATALLHREGHPVSLRVVGPSYGDRYGGYQGKLERALRDRGLDSLVTFTGAVPFGPALMDEYERAGILLIPSLSEGVPKVLCEAMALGVPVVASDVGGLSWVIRRYGGGVLVPTGDAGKFARAIIEVTADWDLYSDAARSAARDLTVEVQSRRVAGFIHRVGEGSPASDGTGAPL